MVKIRVFILLFIALILVGCSNEGIKNTIQQKELSSKNQLLLKAAVGEMNYYYEFIAEKGKFLRIWVERYQYGKLVEQVGGIGTEMLKDEKGEILIYFLDDPEWENYYLRTVVLDESGYAVANGQIAKPNANLNAGIWSSNLNEKVPLTEDMLLGYMAFFEVDDESSMGIKTTLAEPKEFIEENRDIPEIYLIRASLSDEERWEWYNESGEEL